MGASRPISVIYTQYIARYVAGIKVQSDRFKPALAAASQLKVHAVGQSMLNIIKCAVLVAILVALHVGGLTFACRH